MYWIFEDASLLKPASIFLMTFDTVIPAQLLCCNSNGNISGFATTACPGVPAAEAAGSVSETGERRA